MMDRSAIEALRDLSREGRGFIEIDGHKYWERDKTPVHPPFFRPDSLRFVTLTGLVSYLTSEPDRVEGQSTADPTTPLIDAKLAYLHVEDFDRVVILSAPDGPDNGRHRIAEAVSPLALSFPFGQYQPVEDMMIRLRTLFVDNDDLKQVIELITKVDITQGIQLGDNGVAQTVAVNKGISGANKEGVTQKGYYYLKPRRTFDEVDPIESLFLFRLKDGGERGALAALFEAGGDDWRVKTIQRVREWLVNQLSAWKVLA